MSTISITERERDAIDRFVSQLIASEKIEAIVLGFDNVITNQDVSNGVTEKILRNQSDDDIRSNIRNFSFLSALLRVLNHENVRVAIASFQDDLMSGFRETPAGESLYFITGGPVVQRYVDVLLGAVAPQDRRILSLPTDFLLWNPRVRHSTDIMASLSKNEHLETFRVRPGRTAKQGYPQTLDGSKILYFDSCISCLNDAREGNLAIPFKATEGITAEVLNQVTDTFQQFAPEMLKPVQSPSSSFFAFSGQPGVKVSNLVPEIRSPRNNTVSFVPDTSRIAIPFSFAPRDQQTNLSNDAGPRFSFAVSPVQKEVVAPKQTAFSFALPLPL